LRKIKSGRRVGGYSYNIDNSWQGRFRELSVIGDKDASRTTKELS